MHDLLLSHAILLGSAAGAPPHASTGAAVQQHGKAADQAACRVSSSAAAVGVAAASSDVEVSHALTATVFDALALTAYAAGPPASRSEVQHMLLSLLAKTQPHNPDVGKLVLLLCVLLCLHVIMVWGKRSHCVVSFTAWQLSVVLSLYLSVSLSLSLSPWPKHTHSLTHSYTHTTPCRCSEPSPKPCMRCCSSHSR